MEALAGQIPTYLAKLEEEAGDVAAQEGIVLTGRSAEIRAALRGDCHTHSDWSDGGSPIAEMARLRGARTVVVGIRPEVAFAMVRLGLHPVPGGAHVTTALDLEEGLALLGAHQAGGPSGGGAGERWP